MKIDKGSPLITMTAITGKPHKGEIYAYLDEMKAAGIGGIMIYPRSGCELEYMSEEWFAAVRHFVEGAALRGMKIWLYDDFNWPSGDAAGRISSKYHLKAIMTEGEERGKIIDYSTHNSHLFGVKHFPDLLSEDAVDEFIAITHEKYYEKFAEYFGTAIVGIFTDEPSMAYCCRTLEHEDTEGDSGLIFDTVHSLLPYYDGMERDYADRYGRGFRDDLENGADGFAERALATAARKFRRTYVERLLEWCLERGFLIRANILTANTARSH